jgi:hypothetical protein
MSQRISSLRTIKATRGTALTIDLGETFTGTLTSWMKKDLLKTEHIEFSIVDNRYLFLTKAKTQDNFDGANVMKGKWYFDVRLLPIGGTEDDETTIFTGIIFFENNVTN